MLGTLDLEVHHQPVGEVHCLVRAEAVGAVDAVIRPAVDREGFGAVIEAEDAFLLDVLQSARRHPSAHDTATF